ncbi:MAG: hypothetical protein HC911_09465 [Chloroflexaceae bacterium]|nr:hypothetical protein [Chloroflexaceae bacterium]
MNYALATTLAALERRKRDVIDTAVMREGRNYYIVVVFKDGTKVIRR